MIWAAGNERGEQQRGGLRVIKWPERKGVCSGTHLCCIVTSPKMVIMQTRFYPSPLLPYHYISVKKRGRNNNMATCGVFSWVPPEIASKKIWIFCLGAFYMWCVIRSLWGKTISSIVDVPTGARKGGVDGAVVISTVPATSLRSSWEREGEKWRKSYIYIVVLSYFWREGSWSATFFI